MFKKILVANRGEIAVRVIRACRELDVATVAVYSEADRDSLHVSAADEAFHIGPAASAKSYLDIDRIIDVARRAGCDGIHPGYGFLAENSGFARRCDAEGIRFIGPSAAVIEKMGDKLGARNAAIKAKFPIVPGTTKAARSADDVRRAAKKFGYPIAVKAAAGGGGKGLKVAHDAGEVDRALELASKEALTYFKDGTVYVERYLARPKHVEVQILGDGRGHYVHVGERECSLQRRHQKLVEETPANVSEKVRRRIRVAGAGLAKAIGYDSAGTIECLVEGDDFYFLEMNTRIQVEHTITEATWGVDLVKAQIRIAAGEPLWFGQDDLSPRGHAIECRVNAESPADDFRPCPGRLRRFVAPAGPGIRVDSAAFAGWTIPQEYDSLVAKVVAWGEDREESRLRMLRALREFEIEGIDTTIPFFHQLLADELFKGGQYSTNDVDEYVKGFRPEPGDDSAGRSTTGRPLQSEPASAEPLASRTVVVEVNDKRYDVRVFDPPGAAHNRPAAARSSERFKAPKKLTVDGHAVRAPMHGIVAEIRVRPGDDVRDGQVVAVIEAMKMMNEVVAHRQGIVKSIDAAVGETLEAGAPILTFQS